MWIVVEAGPDRGEAAEVTEELLIGSGDSCDLPLQAPDVSARHALVRGGQGTATLTDLGTPSGTFLNGMRLVGSLAVVPGDHIRIGEATTLEVLLDAPGAPSALAAAPLPDGVTPAFEAAPAPEAAVEPAPAAEAAVEPAAAPEAPPRRRGAMIAALVVVLLLIAGIATALAVGGGSRGGAVAAPPRITSFTASAASPIDVHLSWAASGQGFTTFRITRDGQTLATVLGNVTRYEDTTALPSRQYAYGIEGRARNGKNVTHASSVTTPPPPPLAEARLTGRFDVNGVFLQETYQNKHVGEKDYTVWAMIPRCPTGACHVSVRTFAPGQTPTTLSKHGTRYAGTGTDLYSACGSNQNRIRTKVAIAIRVTAARYIDRVWTATRFTGFMSRHAPAAFSCQAASSRLSVAGSLQP
jgi:hypothetical protein